MLYYGIICPNHPLAVRKRQESVVAMKMPKLYETVRSSLKFLLLSPPFPSHSTSSPPVISHSLLFLFFVLLLLISLPLFSTHCHHHPFYIPGILIATLTAPHPSPCSIMHHQLPSHTSLLPPPQGLIQCHLAFKLSQTPHTGDFNFI